MRKMILFIILAIIVLHKSEAADFGHGENNSLFKIGRSKDANEIFYVVRTTSKGSLDLSDPVQIYWKKFTKNGVIEPLTRIQCAFAYGLNFLSRSTERADFQFVSYSKRTFSVRKTRDGRFRVFTTANGAEVEVERLFIQIDGGTFWFPKISRVELHARIPEVGVPVVEIIKP